MTGLTLCLCRNLFLICVILCTQIVYSANPATDNQVRRDGLNVQYGDDIGLADNCVSIKGKNCVCQFTNGSKIDLHGIGNPDGKAWRFDYNSHAHNNFNYAFNPCYLMTKFADKAEQVACEKAVLCQNNKKSDLYYNLGAYENETFDASTANGLEVVYTGDTPEEAQPTTRTSTIQLVCDPLLSTPKFDVIGNNPATQFQFKLTAKQCCIVSGGGVSFGTILCLIFLLAVVIYLVVGVLVNKFIRGATGAEVIPNRSFWADLPALVKEGFVFTAGKIRGCVTKDAEYDAI